MVVEEVNQAVLVPLILAADKVAAPAPKVAAPEVSSQAVDKAAAEGILDRHSIPSRTVLSVRIERTVLDKKDPLTAGL
jgi:hypothetical protein